MQIICHPLMVWQRSCLTAVAEALRGDKSACASGRMANAN
jgi:hypothetical protein